MVRLWPVHTLINTHSPSHIQMLLQYIYNTWDIDEQPSLHKKQLCVEKERIQGLQSKQRGWVEQNQSHAYWKVNVKSTLIPSVLLFLGLLCVSAFLFFLTYWEAHRRGCLLLRKIPAGPAFRGFSSTSMLLDIKPAPISSFHFLFNAFFLIYCSKYIHKAKQLKTK